MRVVAELALVFAVVLSTKWVADAFALVGAGGIAMWSGIVVATALLRARGVRWRDLGLVAPVGGRGWAVTLGLALVTVVTVIAFMVLVLDPLTVRFGLETPADATDRFAFFLGRPAVFLIYLVVVVWLGAALGEELLMRGFVLNRIADLVGTTRLGWAVALVIHALLFGSLHGYQGIPGFIGSASAALVFGLLYLVGGRRLPPVIIGHGLINTISLTAYYLSDGAIT